MIDWDGLQEWWEEERALAFGLLLLSVLLALFLYWAVVSLLTSAEQSVTTLLQSNFQLIQLLPPDREAVGRFAFGLFGCSEPAKCLTILPAEVVPQAEQVLLFVAAVVTFWVWCVLLWNVLRPLAQGFVESGPQNYGLSISPAVSSFLLVGGVGLVALASWAGEPTADGTVVPRTISGDLGLIILSVFALAIVIIGWVPVYQRNAPALRRGTGGLWYILELPFAALSFFVSVLTWLPIRLVNAFDHEGLLRCPRFD